MEKPAVLNRLVIDKVLVPMGLKVVLIRRPLRELSFIIHLWYLRPEIANLSFGDRGASWKSRILELEFHCRQCLVLLYRSVLDKIEVQHFEFVLKCQPSLSSQASCHTLLFSLTSLLILSFDEILPHKEFLLLHSYRIIICRSTCLFNISLPEPLRPCGHL